VQGATRKPYYNGGMTGNLKVLDKWLFSASIQPWPRGNRHMRALL